MAEFGIKATNLQDPSGAMPVIDPVRQPAEPVLDLSGTQGWFTGIGAKAEKPWMVKRNQYQKELSSIEQARLTGEKDDRTARIETSKLTARYQLEGADFGEEYSKSIADTYSQVRTGTGIEEAEHVRRQEVDRVSTFSNEMIKEGIIQKPFSQMSEQERTATTHLYTSLQRVKRVADEADKAYKADVERQKNNFALDSSQFDLEQRRRQLDAQGALSELKSSTMTVLHSNFKDFKQRVADGTMTLAEAQQALKVNFGSVRSTATNLLQGDAASNKDYAETTGYMEQVYSDALDPTKASKALDDEIDRIIKSQQLLMLKNVKNVPQLAAMSRMLPNTDMGKFAATSAALDTLFTDLTNITTTKTIPSIAANDTKTQRETFGAISKTMNAGVAKTSRDPQGDINAAAEGVDAVFKSLGKLDTSDNVSLAYVTDFLSSDTLVQYIKQGKYNPESAQKAIDVFSQTALNSFAQTSGKFIMSQVGEATYTGGQRDALKTPSMLNLVRFEIDDSGKFTAKMAKDPSVTFVASETYMRNLVRDAQKQADELSKFVRAGAHLGGSTDYRKFWEEQGHNFFPAKTFPTGEERKALMAQGWDGVGFPFNKSSWTKKPGAENGLD